jgi:hypothetical protein
VFPSSDAQTTQCANDTIEINNECISISSFSSEEFNETLTSLLQEYLPDYSMETVSRSVRLSRFIAMANIISAFNNNFTEFELGINSEIFLTQDERGKRLGVRSDLMYNPAAVLTEEQGGRGEFGRFTLVNRKLSGRSGTSDGGRRLQKAAVDWHADGFTTKVKQQVSLHKCTKNY